MLDPVNTMPIQDFDARHLGRDRKEALQLDVALSPTGMPIRQTVLVVAGREPGPVLLVSGGVHGDEFEGPLAILRLFDELQPQALAGTFLGLVVVNPPAFEASARCSPVDGLDLARQFPGDASGSPTRQIAYWTGQQLIAKADFYVDLHSSGSDMEMPQMSGYTRAGTAAVAEMSQRMAESFHARVLWSHPDLAPGRTISHALDHDIPAIYTECPASRCASPEDTEVYRRGVRNVLRTLGMMSGDLEGRPSARRLSGSGDTDGSRLLIAAGASGFFVPEARLLDRVETGTRLGTIHSLSGRVLEEVRSPADGCVGLRRLLPTVRAGDRLFMLAQEDPA